MNICNYNGSTDVTDIAKQLRAVSKSVCYLISKGGGGGGGTVTQLIDNDANGVQVVWSDATSTPTPTISLTDITPHTIIASGNITGNNLSGTNTGDQTSVTGNAGTATALQNARTINGTSFNGTANITVTAAAGTLTGTTLNATVVSSSLTSVGTITTGVWQGTAIGDSYISSASTWNAKQSAITFGTGVQTALGVNTGSAGAFILFNGALGTPSSGTLTSATGLPISTGVSGLGTGVATFLATPSSANLITAVTDETGTGSLVFNTNPVFTDQISVNGTSNKSVVLANLASLGAILSGGYGAVGSNYFWGSGSLRATISDFVTALEFSGGDFVFKTAPSTTINTTPVMTERGRLSRLGIFTLASEGIVFSTVGKGVTYKSGTGARAGNATLVGGTVTVTNTTVTANTIVMLTRKTSGGTIGTAITYTLSAGTSFTITSDNVLDTSVFSYLLVEVV